MGQATLVIVEDDMLFAEALASLVESLGYRVLATAASEPSAIKAVLDFRPDAVLMDINASLIDKMIDEAKLVGLLDNVLRAVQGDASAGDIHAPAQNIPASSV